MVKGVKQDYYRYLRITKDKDGNVIMSPEDVKAIVDQVGVDKLMSDDPTISRAAREDFSKRLGERGAHQPGNSKFARAVCVVCGTEKGYKATEWMCHAACTCSRSHPEREAYVLAMGGTKTATNCLNTKQCEALAKEADELRSAKRQGSVAGGTPGVVA